MNSISPDNQEEHDAFPGISRNQDHFFMPPPSVMNRRVSTPSPSFASTPQRPGRLNLATEWGPSSSIARPRSSQIHLTNFNSPRPRSTAFQTPIGAARDSSHRDRLSTLRQRMNVEFGNRERGSLGQRGQPDPEFDDTMSTMSDVPSLNSWQHQMINRNETLVVNASDTMSTCAMSMPPTLAASDSLENFATPQPSSSTSLRRQQSNDTNSMETWREVAASPSSSISPCPRQPPPIPAREHMTSPITPQPRMPPPLPPRTPAMRLPDPIAIEVENRIKQSEEKENGRPTILNKEQAESSSSTPKQSKSNDSLLSGSVSRSGHKKSNSLDRGLTLAKSIKTGPFPPSSSKSNSLSRQEADREEDERNAKAENIIREITSSLQASHLSIGDMQDKLETITSAENSSVSSPSTCASSEKPITVKRILMNSEAPNNSSSYDQLEPESHTTPARNSENRYSRSMSNDELKSKPDAFSASFDPITLDVERRLSMKRSGQLEEDRMSLSDDNTSRMSAPRAGLGHATSFARNSLLYASGAIRGAFRKVRNVAHTGSTLNRSGIGEEVSDEEDGHDDIQPSNGGIVRPRKTKKGPFDFENLTVEQELNNEHTGAVWCIKFSICGRLMATAGTDSILRVWVVKSHLKYFTEMREKYSTSVDLSGDPMDDMSQFRPPSSLDSLVNSDSTSDEDSKGLFCTKPFAALKGHTADILDLSWSKNYFILSSGMDRTVKLWHLSRNECLCCFQHIDFVTCVAFLPKDDRYFLSGSLDGKLRLWHIPDKKVAVWNEVQVKFITALTFVKNGKFAVVGTYNGRCYFYTTDQLKYHTVVDVRSTRGKNAKGHKVTGLAAHGDKLLVTSNDSRIRMYDIRDKALTCKFKGVQNDHSQIRAAFSPDGRHIVCGSEDKFVYLWRTSDMPSSMSVRKDRNSMWERVRTHNAAVSVAVFAPRPQVFFAMLEKREKKTKGEFLDYEQMAQSDSINSTGNFTVPGHAIVSADLQGVIKVLIDRPRQCKASPAEYARASCSSSA